MKNRYKLIKEYPGSPNLGDTVEMNLELDFIFYTLITGKEAEKWVIHKNLIENSPEFWAKYLFTTEDKVDIYEGEKCYAGFLDIVTGKLESLDKIPKRYQGIATWLKYFSTKEAIEEYSGSLRAIKTLDNMDLFIGEKYYEVYKPTGEIRNKILCNGDEVDDDWAMFKFEKNAMNYAYLLLADEVKEERAEMNKSQFSKQDIINMLEKIRKE